MLAAEVVLGLLGTMVSGCGDDETVPPAGAQTAPTTAAAAASTPSAGDDAAAEQLAGALLIAEDLGEGWAVSAGVEPGIVTEAVRPDLPRLEMCPEAGTEAAATAAALEWDAFTVLESPGEGDWPVTVGEFLVSDDPARIDDVFRILLDASAVCAGVDQSEEEVGELIDLPPVGEGRFGVQVLSSDGDVQSSLRAAFVRQGGVLMFLDLFEVGTGGTLMETADWNTIVTTAAGKLP